MENIGYILLGIVAVCWLIAMVGGMIASFPVGGYRSCRHRWDRVPVCKGSQGSIGKQGR